MLNIFPNPTNPKKRLDDIFRGRRDKIKVLKVHYSLLESCLNPIMILMNHFIT